MNNSQPQSAPVVAVAQHVWRLTAPNGGPMTGTGTNTYLLGPERQVIIDPGPALPVHVDAIVHATGGRLTHVLTTHTHMDHSPAAAMLAERLNVTLVGLPPPPHERQDQTFMPDRQPADNERMQLGDVSLRAIHTPGHASNHVCYLLEEHGLLFTGDHVMQGSTVVIPPPDGDMTHYIDSLHKIHALGLAAIAPGHGTLITDPDRALRRLIRHRLQREARVLDRLQKLGRATLDELLPHAYADVDPRMLPVARFSLHAHLIRLHSAGQVSLDRDEWCVMA